MSYTHTHTHVNAHTHAHAHTHAPDSTAVEFRLASFPSPSGTLAVAPHCCHLLPTPPSLPVFDGWVEVKESPPLRPLEEVLPPRPAVQHTRAMQFFRDLCPPPPPPPPADPAPAGAGGPEPGPCSAMTRAEKHTQSTSCTHTLTHTVADPCWLLVDAHARRHTHAARTVILAVAGS